MRYMLSAFLIVLSLTPVLRARRQIHIYGMVTDIKGTPLEGANIFIKSLNLGTSSDSSGKYTLYIPSSLYNGQKADLTVGYVGYKTQTVTIRLNKDSLRLNFSLPEDIFRSEEVVVTGIASKTSKARAEVSVSRIDAAALTNTSSFQTVSQLLEGKISGVQVTSSSGNEGSGFNFYVRGGGGINGDEQPVIYIDGVRAISNQFVGWGVGGQGTSMLSTIDPENIANIQVLKGPAAAAMYGTSSSNGVVLITTKSGAGVAGRTHKLSVNYKFVYGMNTQSYRYKTNDFISANSANAIFRNGIIRQNTLSISGGSNSLRYYGSFDDRSDQGSIPDNIMDRKALRLNLLSYTTPDLTLRITSKYSLTNISRPLNDRTAWGFLLNVLLQPVPYQLTDSAAVFGIKDKSSIESFTGGIQVTFTPLDKLVFYFNGGVDNSNIKQDQTFPQNLFIPTITNGRRTIFDDGNKQFSYDFNVRYSYNLFKKLKVTSIVGAQLYDRTRRQSWMSASDFSTELETDIGSGVINQYGEYFINSREAGIFTLHDFSFADAYYFTMGLREDYASSLNNDIPSILYPKISFAVRFDKYNWFPSKIFNLFKLRAAYGENGQLPGIFDAIPLLWQSTRANNTAGALIYNIGNPSIKPERIKEFESGIDAEFLGNYSIEFTYYRQNASNSIVYTYDAPSTGYTESSIPYNIAGIKDWGFESLLQASLIRSRNYGLDLGLIWNYQNNKVTSLGGADPIYDQGGANVIKKGLPKHEFYLQKVIGAKFDSNGKYAGVDATNYQVDMGNSIPNYTGSLTFKFRFFKNFNFYALTVWALNRSMLNATKLFAALYGNVPEYNTLKAQLGLTKDNQEMRLTPGSPDYINAAEKFARMDPNYYGNYIENADYLKIRELSISYSFKDILPFNKYGYIKDITLGISALNVWTLTGYSGADVEFNTGGSRSLTRGVDFFTLQHPRVYNMWVRIGI